MPRAKLPSLLAASFILATAPAWADSPIVHRVSVGGPDACAAFGFEHPGCNANFSLIAIERSDGSVTGHLIDRLGKDDGFHAVINCLVVDGNNAWASGVVIQGHIGTTSQVGRPVVTRVQDNGTSKKDPVDKISYSWLGDARPCTMKLNYQLLDAPDGQVKVD